MTVEEIKSLIKSRMQALSITEYRLENRRGKENEYFEIANRRIENAQLKIF